MTEARVTQVAEEVLSEVDANPYAIVTQNAIETLSEIDTAPSAVVSQIAAEVLLKLPYPWGDLHPLVAMDSRGGQDDLWEHPGVLLANWTTSVVLESTWQTDVMQAQSVSETRRGLVSKPKRTLTYELSGLDQVAANLLHSTLLRMGCSRFLAPMYHDISPLTEAASPGDTRLHCDTADRHFNDQMRVLLANPSADAEIASWEIAHVDTKATGQLNLISQVLSSWASGTMVLPLVECLLLPTTSGNLHTDESGTATISVQEADGHSGLSPCLAADTLDEGWQTFDDLPILTIPPQWDGVQFGAVRAATISASAVASVVTAYGSRPCMTWTLPFLFSSRAEAYELLRFFDSRCGRLYPFWLPSPQTHYSNPVKASDSTLSVDAVGAVADYALRPYLCLVLLDGTHLIRGITGVSRSGSRDTLTLDYGMYPATTETIYRACAAAKVRFSDDTLQETWHTDLTASCTLSVIEVLEEKDIDIDDLPDVTIGDVFNQRWRAYTSYIVVSQCKAEVLTEISATPLACVSQLAVEVLLEVSA